jgi:hypothetical protein
MAASMEAAQKLCSKEAGSEKERCIMFYTSKNPVEDTIELIKKQRKSKGMLKKKSLIE